MIKKILTNRTLFSPATLLALLLFTAFSGIVPAVSLADSDVYRALPSDTRVLRYTMADFDGDKVKELAILYTAAGKTHVTLFKGKSGHWSRWRDGDGTLTLSDGSLPTAFQAADVNGDGRAEILAYYLTGNNSSMTTRILTLNGGGPADPDFKAILEDATSPPGYPVLGKEKSSPSVTFLNMGTERKDGYRRVYCWNGTAFGKCKEVVWRKP